MNKKLQTIETYQKSATAMATKFDSLPTRTEDVIRGLQLFPEANPNVLEIGCGHGREAIEILKHTPHYLGIDISEGFIRMAQEQISGGVFSVADLEEFVFPQGLDVIFAFASLLHSSREKLAEIFTRAYTALNEGGIFYISLKRAEKYEEETKEDEFGVRNYYLYNAELIKEIAGNGYSAVYEDTQTLRGQNWFTIALKKLKE